MSLRDQPRPLDWIGVGLRVIGLGLTINDERRRANAGDPWRYFSDVAGDEWTEVPEEFRRLMIEHVQSPQVDEAYWDGDVDAAYVSRGRIGDEVVGWVAERDKIVDGPYVLTKRQVETYSALGDRVWRRLGTRYAYYGSSGLVGDPFANNDVIATAQMTNLATRIKRFVDAGEPRSYLLAGPPGTGKSLAIRWAIGSLGMTSLRIDLAVLARIHGTFGSSIPTSLETLLRLLRPRAIILDDLDRIDVTAALLAFLELAQRTSVVVVASANSVTKMMGAALRPGRFDEIIRIDRLDPEVLRTLLGDDGDLFDRLAALPAAYVVELMKRRRVLGRDTAVAELDELIARCDKIRASSDSDSDSSL
ncbi:MAG: AAA family ATPase [Kofleriaceae bacterium]